MSTPLNAPKQCPNCGKPVPASAPGGICPACLMAQGAETDGAPQRPRFEPPPLETVAALFPKLELISLLGAGGMGAVYKARQPDLDRFVALKLLPKEGPAEGATAERFNREARALARLSHPNIVAVHEFGQVEGLHFFIMEFVDGANLRQMELTGRLSAREALQIIPQICDALQYAHDAGVVHRDIKPENVLVDRKGRVKIADFGLAKIMGVDAEALRLTVDGQVMGTPHYMAPEQVERPLAVDHRADIYSLGVVFYEMLTGDLPIGKFAPPSRKVQLDVRLDDIVLRALENDPERRYQRASEVKTRVETVSGSPASPAAPPAGHPIRWAGFPLVAERDGKRRVNRKEMFKMFGIFFAALTIVFGLVSLVTGHTYFGWLGISGLMSLLVRLIIAALVAAWGVGRALRYQENVESLPRTPQGTLILAEERFSRMAIIGAGWIGFLLAAFPMWVMNWTLPVAKGADWKADTSTHWWQILLTITVLVPGLLAPFGTTLLGWIAVGGIRRAQGRISGLPLAVFNGLVFPLLVLDVFLGLGLHNLFYWFTATQLEQPFQNPPPEVVVSGVVLILALVDFLIVRQVWRAVRLGALPSASTGEWWWNTRRGAVSLGLLCVLVIAAVSWRSSGSASFKNARGTIVAHVDVSGTSVAVLPNGGSVELLGISDIDSASNGWWRADGKTRANTTFAVRERGSLVVADGQMKDFILRFTGLESDAVHSIEFVGSLGSSGISGADKVFQDGKAVGGDVRHYRVAFPNRKKSASIRVSLGIGPWRTVAAITAPNWNTTSDRRASDPVWNIRFLNGVADSSKGAQISYLFEAPNDRWADRVVLVDTNDVEHSSSTGSGSGLHGTTGWALTFPGVEAAAVKEVRFQVRPLQYLVFADVALTPKSALPKRPPLRFGEVLNRSFDELIDFDTGRTAAFPSVETGSNPLAGIGDNILWAQKNGYDAAAGADGLEILNTEFAPVADADWDRLTPQQVVDSVYHGRFAPRVLKPLNADGSGRTFAYETREHGCGLVQFVAAPEASGVTLRLKQVIR